MAVDLDDFELEKLRAEIHQERQMKEMLEQSAAELRATVEELEKRYDSIDNEGNEWKTRFETQQEINGQLERQILNLQNKVQEARSNLKDAGKSPRDLRNFDDLSDANPHMIRLLDKEKNVLSNQLRDMEWRLDQESKAYHKANDERKTYSLEINAAKGSITELSSRSKLPLTARDADAGSRMSRAMGKSAPNVQRLSSRVTLNEDEYFSSPNLSPRRSNIKTIRNTNYRSIRALENEIREMGNIPEDQRILDPKKGPIRKTAGVKNLPSLETT